MPGRAVLRVVLRVALVMAALRAIGVIVSRRGNAGDAESDEFSIATVFGGVERVSRATSLRHGRVFVCLGGVELDLREATLDPGGAELRLRACLGGVEVLVSPAWRVVFEGKAIAGGADARVTPESELADDAPALHVRALAVLGGVEVTTESDDEDEAAEDSVPGSRES